MAREPIKCNKCGVYLSGKNRDDPKKQCNKCNGITYSPRAEGGRKMLWKSK